MKITNEILKNFVNCKYKLVQLELNEAPRPKSSFQYQREYLEKKALDEFIKSNDINLNKISFGGEKRDQNNTLNGFYKVSIIDNDFSLNFPLVEFGFSKTNHRIVKCYFFSSIQYISKAEAEYNKILSVLLSEKMKVESCTYLIIFAHELKYKKVKVVVNESTDNIRNRIYSAINDKCVKPTIISHCSICTLNNFCKLRLIEEGSLKLLRRMPDKQIDKYNSKGIFTIRQLSYIFRPRRKNQNTKKKGRYLYELKALSLREGKTNVLNKPTISKFEYEIFIDFEGSLNHAVYLIGAILFRGKVSTRHVFWSDKSDGRQIFLDFFDFLYSLEKPYCLFHYGSYEIRAMRKANQKFNLIDEDQLHNIERSAINVLDFFYSDIFPPTYSNSLKDIAKYIGFHWSAPNANGIQVSCWRREWLEHRREKTKRKIITYNIEDCIALIVVKEWLLKIIDTHENTNEIITDSRMYFKALSSLKYGKTSFVLEEYQEINKLAYFDYQRKKVIVREEKFKKLYSPKDLRPKLINIVNRKVFVSVPKCCPKCHSSRLVGHQNYNRVLIDLKIRPTAIKKDCILFHGKRFRCTNCKYAFTPLEYKRQPTYGYNLRIWIINQIFSYRMSYGNIKKSLFEYFQINITVSFILNVRAEFANLYSDLIKEFAKELKEGNLIQGDETKIKLRKESGYVWVLTNLTTVIYYYQPNREGAFFHEFIEGFKGVVVSDFYAVYDSIKCPQQKCLIHLIRDINDDLFKNQTNQDLQVIANEFGLLLKKIISTVDKYGLKKRNLNKHNKDVLRFYENLDKGVFNTELGEKWIKRLLKNKEKLFTFLGYDGVPWNNNNAEHAVKSFAFHRREINGFYTRKGIEEFLTLLSISETCKFRNISFWEFLKSRKTELKDKTA